MDASASTSCFDTAPEFVDEDNRRFRGVNPISKQQMTAKHSVLLPESLIRGKTILDLGCCLAATGHWCLSNGAAHYTGVEVQPEYADGAQRLMSKYHPGQFTIHNEPIEKWLAAQRQEPAYDIVVMLGVIYVFIDYFSILKHITAIAKSTFVVEALYFGLLKKMPNICGVMFIDEQQINVASEQSSIHGRGTRISPKGMEWLMGEFGFKSHEGLLYPPPITEGPDLYNRPLEKMGKGKPVRYLMRFHRTDTKTQSLSEDLQNGGGRTKRWR